MTQRELPAPLLLLTAISLVLFLVARVVGH
jgi:hypothetical protein